jgi:hypothetical protein
MSKARQPKPEAASTPEPDVDEQIHRILREAAEKREARARAQSIEDQADASRQLDALITLARAQSRVQGRRPSAPDMPARAKPSGS